MRSVSSLEVGSPTSLVCMGTMPASPLLLPICLFLSVAAASGKPVKLGFVGASCTEGWGMIGMADIWQVWPNR